MSDAKRSAVVLVYCDDTKDELLVEIPIIDLGLVMSGDSVPNSDEGLIYIAKHQIRATRSEDAESLHYEVLR